MCLLHPRGGFQADLATLECVTSSFPAEHRTSTHTQALILDQTTHRGTLNAQRPVQTEPDAHKRGARRLVANNMLIFETFFFGDRRPAAVWWHPELKPGATLSRQGGRPGGVACILMPAWLIFISAMARWQPV